MEGLRFRGGDMELKKGDVIYVYTDGVTEATNAEDELFGMDRMLDALNIDINAELEQIDTNVRSAIDDFVADAPQFDDITMLTFRYNGKE
jgi:serine phosphatase RsbU (regulator of sigma subunit)